MQVRLPLINPIGHLLETSQLMMLTAVLGWSSVSDAPADAHDAGRFGDIDEGRSS